MHLKKLNISYINIKTAFSMKNILVILFTFTLFIISQSCKKSYNCECTFKNDKTILPLAKQSKKDATKECSKMNDSWQDSNGSCVISK